MKGSEQLLGAVHETLKLGYIRSFNGREVDCTEPDYLDALIGAAANEVALLSLAAKDFKLTEPRTSRLNGLSVKKEKDKNFLNCVVLPTVTNDQTSKVYFVSCWIFFHERAAHRFDFYSPWSSQLIMMLAKC